LYRGREIRDWFLNPWHFAQMMERRPEIALEWLRLAREVGATAWLERLEPEFLEVFKGAIRSNLSKVPLGYARDIKWYAENTHLIDLIYLEGFFS